MDILVTGSSGGIGFHIAKTLKGMGHNVLLTGRNTHNLKNAAEKLSSLFYAGDLGVCENADELVGFGRKNGFGFDAAVHTVGGVTENDKHPLNPEVIDRSMNLNLYGAVAINNQLFPDMEKKGFGRILHVSSQAAADGNASPAYAMAKSALNIYIKNAARFYADKNIMICGIMPGILDHEGSAWHKKSIEEPKKYAAKMAQQPLKRFLKPEDICGLAAFLVTDTSMAYTGSIISMNGGV